MKTCIAELDGKYYGTELVCDLKDGQRFVLTVWLQGKPSQRYLQSYGYSEEQWASNDIVDDGWGGLQPIRDLDLVCDEHYESQLAYDLMVQLKKFLDGLDL